MIQRFRIRIAFVLATILATTALPAYAAEIEQACHGRDLLADLKTQSPDVFARITEEARKVANGEAEFWRIEKTGTPPSFLFGTMHLSDARITELSPKVKDAIAQSKTVALELADVGESAMASAMTKSASLIAFTDGRRLDSFLSPEEFEKTKSIVAKTGLPAEAAAMLRPWLVSMLLSTSECERAQTAGGAKALDLHIAAEAKAHGLTPVGLETIESQFAAMASIPEDQQIQMLKFDLKNASRANDLMETLVQIYLHRQIGMTIPLQLELLRQSGFSETTFDGFRNNLLLNRNTRMRDAALPLLDKGNAFIAVGALHLVGDKGLIALLRESGYTITAIE